MQGLYRKRRLTHTEPMPSALLRIGALSQRTGVSPELLRAWERRYGLLQPARTEGRFRLYSEADLRRVVAMRDLVDAGVAASEAARVVLAEARISDTEDPSGRPLRPASTVVDALCADLRQALRSFDETAAHAAFDALVATLDLDSTLRDVVLPELRQLGEDWAAGTATVAQEHFASSFLRSRLFGLARGWARGGGPLVLLACPPGEAHDISLLIFGLAMHSRGWRVTFLGADTPIDTLVNAARAIRPRLVVLFSTLEERFEDALPALRQLAGHQSLALAGAGATPRLASALPATLLSGDPVSEADSLSS